MITLQPGTYRDLDFHDTVQATGAGFAFIGCAFYGGLAWMDIGGTGSVRECVFYPHNKRMHAIYTHNNAGGEREISRCLFCAGQGSGWGLHIYSGSHNMLNDFTVHDCVNMAPVQVGGGGGVRNLLYRDNLHFGCYAGFGTYAPFPVENEGLIIENQFINPSGVDVVGGFTCSRNSVIVPVARPVPDGFRLVAMRNEQEWFIPFHEAKRWCGIGAACIDGRVMARAVPRKSEVHVRNFGVDSFFFGLAALVWLRERRGK